MIEKPSKEKLRRITTKSILGCEIEKYLKEPILKKNKLVISRVSKFVSITNKDFFLSKLNNKEKIPEEIRDYIRVSTEPIEDDLGRITFFFIKIGPFKIPIPQPGAFMFTSAVKSNTDLVVDHGGQQNGAILGNGCALFLSKFLAILSKNYYDNCSKELKDGFDFYPNIYKNSLINALSTYATEDANEYCLLFV